MFDERWKEPKEIFTVRIDIIKNVRLAKLVLHGIVSFFQSGGPKFVLYKHK